MTAAGHALLTEEYETLFKKERPIVVARIAAAAAEGDRSENAEYIYGKKRLREVDKRLKYLGALMKNVQVVHQQDVGTARVSFGARVTLIDEEGCERIYRIVGQGESDVIKEGISVDAPFAKALLGKSIGDVITIHRPAGELEVEIQRIER